MGAEASSLHHYELGRAYEGVQGVRVSPATHLHEKKHYTVFQYEKRNSKTPENVQKHIEVMKTVRHPYILRYVTQFDTSRRHVTLVTEHAIPLDVAVETQESEEIFAGLYNVLEALVFLHDRAMICHNQINVSSVFVTDDGVWKLAAFQNSNKVQRLSKQSFKADIEKYGEFALSVLDYLKDDDPKTIAFKKRLENGFGENKKSEVSTTLKSLQNDAFFRSPFLEMINNLQNLALKTDVKKKSIYQNLASQLCSTSALAVGHRLIKLLFSNVLLSDPAADQYFLKHLFCTDPSNSFDAVPIYDNESFVKYSTPCILELFTSRDKTIRSVLLKYFSLYASAFQKDVLRNTLLPELLLGLRDTDDAIVTSTFIALANLVPLLGGDTVVGGERGAHFCDWNPDFTRSADHREKATISSVSDVIRTSPITSSSSGFSSAQSVAEEKKQRRLERETKREEQRRLREERRREKNKSTKTIAIPSEKFVENEGPVEQSNNTVGKTGENNGWKENNDDTDGWDDDENHSEPDWEGFVAFSSDTEQKEEQPDDSWGWENEETRRESTVSNASHELYTAFDENKDEQNESVSQTSRDEEDLTPAQNDSPIASNSTNIPTARETPAKKNSGLKLTSARKIKPRDTEKVQGRKREKDLGSEFDIQIQTRVAEPDYFADMLPSLDSSAAVKTVLIEKSPAPTYSAKFDAVVENEVGSLGWEDDGWDTE